MMAERSGEDLRKVRADATLPSDVTHGEVTAVPDPLAAGKRKTASLSPQTRDRIAMQLRSMYESVANQPVPDRFADLIARLDNTDADET